MSNQFLELWQFFFSRPHVRSWLCDPVIIPTQYAIAHSREPPIRIIDSSISASHVLFVLGHDESVALGALQLSNSDFTHRTAVAYVPLLGNQFIASFGWAENGNLEVRFGHGGFEPSATREMHCRWVHFRIYNAIVARKVSRSSSLRTAMLSDGDAVPQEAFRDTDELSNVSLLPSQAQVTSPLSSVVFPSTAGAWQEFGGHQRGDEHGPRSQGQQGICKGSLFTNPVSLFDEPNKALAPASAEPAATCSSVSVAAAAAQICAADAADSIPVEKDLAPFPGDKDPEHGVMDQKFEHAPVSVKEPPFLAANGAVQTKHDGDLAGAQEAHHASLASPPRSNRVEKDRKSTEKKKRPESQTLECPTCHTIIRGKRGNLNRHIAARHERLRAFACAMPGCSLAFQSKLNLVRHMTRVHEGRPHKCTKCPRRFRTAATLAKHVRAAHKWPRKAFVCTECAVCFGRRSVLDNHVDRVHGVGKVAGMPGYTMFECPVPGCAKRFLTWDEQREHEREKHQGNVHQCTGCSAVFNNEETLSRHIRTDHGHTKTSKNCPVCGCVYSQRSNLLRHITLAHKDYKRECEL